MTIKLSGDVYYIKNGCELEIITKAGFPVFPNPNAFKDGPKWITPLTLDFVKFRNTYADSNHKYVIANYR